MYFGKIKNSDKYWFGDTEECFETSVLISNEEYGQILYAINNTEKTVTADEEGKPILVDLPEPPEKEKAKRRIEELESYLKQTDWYAIRFADTGEKMPADIKKKRQEARDEISRLREEHPDSNSNSNDD